VNLTKNDYMIMNILYDNGCLSKMCSFTLQKISDTTNLSIYKIRDAMKLFINLGLVDEGARDVRAKTYFLSVKGRDIVEENKRTTSEIANKYLKNKMKGDN
jgi:DNA-binding MarR family transcriptional regulator